MTSFKRLLATAFLSISSASYAGAILGGSALLDDAGLTQLENWHGEGALTLTKIFTKVEGSNINRENFHRAVDGIGPTFTLMSASEDNGLTWKTVGGYTSLSRSTNGARISSSADPDDWTAFVFNLTDSILWTQRTSEQEIHNSFTIGPNFGAGYDLGAAGFYLDVGYSFGATFGSASDFGKSIVDGSSYDGENMLIGALEVFTLRAFSPPDVVPSPVPDPLPTVSVPEPATVSLLGLALLGLTASRRKTRA